VAQDMAEHGYAFRVLEGIGLPKISPALIVRIEDIRNAKQLLSSRGL
jgi:hypothetical protein